MVLAMSKDGMYLVIGSPNEKTVNVSIGKIHVYYWDTGAPASVAWKKFTNLPQGASAQTTSADDFGSVVCISTLGKYIATTSPINHSVYVYQTQVTTAVNGNVTRNLVQIGGAITWESLEGASSSFGCSLALPQALFDGSETIFIGDLSYKSYGGVVMYKYAPPSNTNPSTDWVKIKVFTPGFLTKGVEPTSVNFGKTLYTSENGVILAVGSTDTAYIYKENEDSIDKGDDTLWTENVIQNVPSSSLYVSSNDSSRYDLNSSIRVITGGAFPATSAGNFSAQIYDSVVYSVNTNTFTFQKAITKLDVTAITDDPETFFGSPIEMNRGLAIDAGFPADDPLKRFLAIGAPKSTVNFLLNNQQYEDVGTVVVYRNDGTERQLPTQLPVKLISGTSPSPSPSPSPASATTTEDKSKRNLIIIIASVVSGLLILAIVMGIFIYFKLNKNPPKYRTNVMAMQ
jgi:hypothetical protein